MNGATWLAAALAGLAAATAIRSSPQALLKRRLGRGRPPPKRNGPSRALIAAVIIAGATTTTVIGGPAGILVALLAAAAATVGKRILSARRANQARRVQQAKVREACGILATELAAGRPPENALQAAADVLPELAPIAATGRMGGDIPTALRAIDGPGTEALRQIAAAWAVAEHSGAGLAGVVAKVANGLGADELQRREVAAQLAAPRATAKLLAGLPVFGLVLGAGVGSNPYHVLFGTGYGIACLVVGAALTAAGLFWVERLAQRAERPP
ncbi:type II secretion system F family protein [Tenggerimyces flavus]|uniref:Type II secretion system F family protein n=1 Tax=Tenggerimyces flavus TaxID=1708749 RepID=A0ABV7YDN4_9ACTN|nr:type II secretion system F family protein [Tenggerimyces flavus]MBM7783443.1 tight adherence protein B [Tenggerimyces flavus]